MLQSSVKIQGVNPAEHIKKFGKVPVKQALRRAVGEYTRWAETQYKPYPPETAANRPPGKNGRWYVRGSGTRTRSGKLYRTSQRMDKRWKTQLRYSGNSVRATITNKASYTPFVQGENQRRYHAMRGWKRVDKVFEISEARLQRTVEKEIKGLEK